MKQPQPDTTVPVRGTNGAYKIYTALLTQSGTNPPTAKILQNTIGNITWSRIGVGKYEGTLTGQITTNKTHMLATPTNDGNSIISIDLTGWPDYVYLETYQLIQGATPPDIIPDYQDGYLNDTPIEIKVFN